MMQSGLFFCSEGPVTIIQAGIQHVCQAAVFAGDEFTGQGVSGVYQMTIALFHAPLSGS